LALPRKNDSDFWLLCLELGFCSMSNYNVCRRLEYPGIWSGGSVPLAGGNAPIAHAVTVNTTATIQNLTINSGA